MKLLKVNLEIPEVIMEMEEYIKGMVKAKKEENPGYPSNRMRLKRDIPLSVMLENDYCFGGGAFSNLYIEQYTPAPIRGKVINDIDIYVDNMYFNEEYIKMIPGVENVDMEDHRSGGYAVRGWDTIREVLRFTYKGMHFQIISLYFMKRIWYFDFRFRNFYYKNGEVFASKGAIEDINNKEIVAVSFGSPLSSTLRGLKFEYELNMTFSETSKQMLLCCLAEDNVDLRRVTMIIEHLTQNPETREYVNEQFQKLIKGKTINRKQFSISYDAVNQESVTYPFHEQSRFFLKCYNPALGEDNYHALNDYQYNQLLGKEVVIEGYKYDYFFRIFKEYRDELESLINVLAYNQLLVEYTTADFDKAMELFAVKKISYAEHKEQIDNVILAIYDGFRCEKTELILPLHIKEHFAAIAKHHWSVTISYDVEDTLGSIYGEKLVIKINPNSRCSSGHYDFRKVQDGNYVLTNTECSSKYFYHKNVRKKLLNALQKACGNMRLGVKGDTTTIRDFGNPGYWFQYTSTDTAVLNHNQ